MGRSTQAAAELIGRLQTKGGDAHTDSMYGRVNTAFVFGVLVVKDWSGNVHLTRVINSEDYHVHAEDAMYALLRGTYRGAGLPFDAKVIFYITRSPCRKCTANMIDQIFGLYQEIAGQRQLYFSFVFDKYYLESSNENSNRAQQNAWSTPWEADAAYRQLEAEADTQGQQHFGRNGIITIRHVAETKGGGDPHRAIAYAWGIRS